MTLLEKYNDDSIERTNAETAVFGMLDELNDRKGMIDFYNIDEDIQEEILESLVKVVDESYQYIQVTKKN